jgi:hypothetical protein
MLPLNSLPRSSPDVLHYWHVYLSLTSLLGTSLLGPARGENKQLTRITLEDAVYSLWYCMSSAFLVTPLISRRVNHIHAFNCEAQVPATYTSSSLSCRCIRTLNAENFSSATHFAFQCYESWQLQARNCHLLIAPTDMDCGRPKETDYMAEYLMTTHTLDENLLSS